MYLLFRSGSVGGGPNRLLAHYLFGAQLGSHWLSGAGAISGQGAGLQIPRCPPTLAWPGRPPQNGDHSSTLKGGPDVSEFDELVAADGVLMAGPFGPDGGIAEYKAGSLSIGHPVAAEMAQWFCAAITTMFGSVAYVIDCAGRTGFDQASWLPVRGWAYTGGDYAIVVRGTVHGRRTRQGGQP